MTTIVVDASVAIKWIFPDRPQESNTPQALQVLQHLREGRCAIVQPPHWLAEVAAVASRLDPKIARQAIALLYALEFPVADGVEVYERACDLAITLDQHVFDTLYHAVALTEPDAVLVTADEHYYRKGSQSGRIVRLRDFQLTHNTEEE
jgi:predicted nucleic acid-binding protein